VNSLSNIYLSYRDNAPAYNKAMKQYSGQDVTLGEDYVFYYEFETSYKGWTEGPHDGDCSLDDAFSDVEDKFELDPTGLHGMSFKEFLEYQCYDNEKEFFDKWFAIFDGKDDTLREKMDNRMWDARMVSNPEWEGTYYYNKNEIKNFFRKATYLKTAKKK
jgi:hypothetical protein